MAGFWNFMSAEKTKDMYFLIQQREKKKLQSKKKPEGSQPWIMAA